MGLCLVGGLQRCCNGFMRRPSRLTMASNTTQSAVRVPINPCSDCHVPVDPRAHKDHTLIRILHNSISGIRLILGLRTSM